MSQGRKKHRRRLRGERRARKRDRYRVEKEGACQLFPRPKMKYHCRNVALHDLAMIQSRCPDYQFEVFKCRCGSWHIGRVEVS